MSILKLQLFGCGDLCQQNPHLLCETTLCEPTDHEDYLSIPFQHSFAALLHSMDAPSSLALRDSDDDDDDDDRMPKRIKCINAALKSTYERLEVIMNDVPEEAD